MVDIGNKIKELRTEQKMTQSDLAESVMPHAHTLRYGITSKFYR